MQEITAYNGQVVLVFILGGHLQHNGD